MMQNPDANLILASQSPSRAAMLSAAGLEFDIVAADIDEAAVRDVLTRSDERVDPADIAEILARAKAENGQLKFPRRCRYRRRPNSYSRG